MRPTAVLPPGDLNGMTSEPLDGRWTIMSVRNVVRGYFYQLQQLRSVRRSLTTDARRTLASAFVASRVDYSAILSSTEYLRKSVVSCSWC